MINKLENLRAARRKGEGGFTIIEVLIVLAIAGLIMLIVFLAVPALQRNQRNSTRNQEASRISTAVTECLSNRNGVTASCSDTTNVNAGTLTRLETVNFSTGAGTATYATDAARVVFNAQCSTDGASAVASTTGARSFAVTYQLENNVNRCISS